MTGLVRRALPWLFIAAVVTANNLPWRDWLGPHLPGWMIPSLDPEAEATAAIVRDASSRGDRRKAEVVRIIDGDTFVARVFLSTGQKLTTRVRLRDIDAAELGGAACDAERRLAEAARDALKAMLAPGTVTLSHIGQDRYPQRIDAHVAAGGIADVSAALLAAGHARSYYGGQRQGWC